MFVFVSVSVAVSVSDGVKNIYTGEDSNRYVYVHVLETRAKCSRAHPLMRHATYCPIRDFEEISVIAASHNLAQSLV